MLRNTIYLKWCKKHFSVVMCQTLSLPSVYKLADRYSYCDCTSDLSVFRLFFLPAFKGSAYELSTSSPGEGPGKQPL